MNIRDIKSLIGAVAAASIVLFTASCENKTPEEKAVDAVEEANEEIGEAIEEAVEKVGDAAEEAAE